MTCKLYHNYALCQRQTVSLNIFPPHNTNTLLPQQLNCAKRQTKAKHSFGNMISSTILNFYDCTHVWAKKNTMYCNFGKEHIYIITIRVAK